MRVVVEETPDAVNHRAYLNGDFVKLCIEANDVAGYVVVLKTDSNGHVVVDETSGESMTETLWGLVRIEAPAKKEQ